jgi:hypothetical protein
VPGKPLREADVFGLAVDGRTGRVTQNMEAHVAGAYRSGRETPRASGGRGARWVSRCE